MKTLYNFLSVFPKITLQCLHNYFLALKEVWTEKSVFWSFDQTFFIGDNDVELKERRDKFMVDCQKIAKNNYKLDI